jgi:hypothetical protein
MLCAISASCGHESTRPGNPEPEPTTPQRNPLVFKSGRGIADTIEAKISTPIVVNVIGYDGAPRAGVSIQFDVVGADGVSEPTRRGTLTIERFRTTDAAGNATAFVQLGLVAGTWVLRALDTGTGDTDTLSFTVRPGHAAQIEVAPRDSAVYVGNTYSVTPTTLDSAANPVAGSVRFSIDSGSNAATVTADGRVGGSAFGRARMTAQLVGTSAIAVARVSVVPQGVLAVGFSDGVPQDGVATVNLDGSDYRTLTRDRGILPAWAPDRSAIVYNVGGPLSILYRVDFDGTRTKLSRLGALPSEMYARYSPDAQFIYYTGGVYPDSMDTYRMRADGSDTPVRVTPRRPGSARYWHASPSPDGSRLVYSANGAQLHVLTLSDQSDRGFALDGQPESPRFSPDGAWIAYVDDDADVLRIIRSNDTDRQQVSRPGTSVFGAPDWSPDGAWIVFTDRDLIQVVRVADRLTIPLPFSEQLVSPAWRPW